MLVVSDSSKAKSQDFPFKAPFHPGSFPGSQNLSCRAAGIKRERQAVANRGKAGLGGLLWPQTHQLLLSPAHRGGLSVIPIPPARAKDVTKLFDGKTAETYSGLWGF